MKYLIVLAALCGFTIAHRYIDRPCYTSFRDGPMTCDGRPVRIIYEPITESVKLAGAEKIGGKGTDGAGHDKQESNESHVDVESHDAGPIGESPAIVENGVEHHDSGSINPSHAIHGVGSGIYRRLLTRLSPGGIVNLR